MSSRRLMNRSLSSDGRSYYSGSDISSQNRRAGCRSYLSSVRSESRSTLCSVMAQLTEETQPTFESTLKSKAVSEDTNVKFSCVVSGHPVPEVTWYKDDIQLDRYCGLPKYEISRDEKTHTLQIYNCTLEDAAIYQASAQNSRGIVSCSGVLEVGTMSEYKIHQNYFAKLKLRNENRRREQEEPCNTGTENTPGVFEHVRMSSPERAQWKRRSPIELSRRAGSPTEEKAMEEDDLSQTPPLEDRLSTPDQVSTEAPVHGISNPETITNREKDSEGLTYIHDTVHNASSKQTNDHVKKFSAATERSKENRLTGRREEMVNEKMEVENIVAQIASVTESRDKSVITDTKRNVKLSVKEKKSVSGEVKRPQDSQIVSVTKPKNRMDINDKQQSEKQSVKANKTDSQRAQVAPIASTSESTNKMDINDGQQRVKQSVKANKCGSEEIKRDQDVQITSVIESKKKIETTDTKIKEKQTVKVNRRTSEESKRAQGAQTASVTESRNTIPIKDTKTDVKQSVKANKSESKTTTDHQMATVAESRNKIEESKRAQDTQINLKTKVDVTDMKTSEKQSEKAKENASQSKKFQKPTANRPALKVSMTTQTNKVVEKTKLTEQSNKGISNPQLQALDSIQNGNPRFTDNKPMDFDDHRYENPVGTCVRILPRSCGGNDVNVDTGERNASARSLRGLASADAHTEPTVPPIHEEIPSVATDIKEKPTLMREVTASVTETLYSCHLASKEQELRAGDQSVASTNSRTLVTRPQNTQMSDKISSGHDSHKLQEGQVSTAMSFSLGGDTLPHKCEKDSKAENQPIEEPDKPRSETKPASMSLNNKEESERKNITTDVFAQSSNSKEKSIANSNHSTNQITGTECVQVCTSNSVVVPPENTNGSSVSNIHMKDAKTQEFKIASCDHVAKKDKQEQSNVTTSEVPVSTSHKAQSYSAKKGHTDPSTFLSQHSKALPTEFTIPAIYITDMDSTSQNNTETEHTLHIVEIRTEANAVISNMTSSNSVNQISDNSHCTETMKQTVAIHQSKGLHDEKFKQPVSQGPESSHSATDNVASGFIVPSEVTMQRHNTEKSIKTNESELNIDSEPFIRQLKKAALDLEITNQCSTMSSATQHINSKGNGKYAEKVNSAVIQTEACKAAVPPKTREDQSFNSTAAHSELATRTDQTTTFPRNKTEKSEIAMAVCLEETNRETYQGHKLSLKTRPASPLQSVNNSPLMMSIETHSPRLTRRSVPADLSRPAGNEDISPKSTEKNTETQFKVPQVIRKIRPEVFDASGNLKLWCQFFNIVSDSTIRWYKDEVEIAEINRSAGDEVQVCLAIIQMTKRDCGGYKCTITNEYGKDSTEYHLSTEFLSSMFRHGEHQEVGEEIEMTPLIFGKGLADAGCWGSKFYGRVTTEESQVGLGCEHKTRRLKVIYGLDPVFESGSSCFMKVRSPIAYESREETVLAEKNLQITKQDCRIQNMAREYFKIFAVETRVIESFGATLEVIPLYFTYWPASSVPYATVEAELKGVYLRYCGLDRSGSLVLNEKSEVGQKCCSLQHWIHQWTNGNVLFSRLEGVDTILTNIGVAIRSKGYQGFPCEANPKVFDQFQIQHQCNYFCGLLNLKPLKAPETPQTPVRSKGSSSPLLQQRTASNSSSPQTPHKVSKSPKISRKGNPQSST